MTNLTQKQIRDAVVPEGKKTTTLGDGDGLYLKVERASSERNTKARKYWQTRVTFNGQRLTVGIGSAHEMTPQEARETNLQLRRLAREGIDPRRSRVTRTTGATSFADIVETYSRDKTTEFKNPKHIQQWKNTLVTYAVEAGLGSMPVAEITMQDVLQVLQPIWHTKTETAARVRGRIEKVLDSAIADGKREGPNPARWKGNLETKLPNPSKLKRRLKNQLGVNDDDKIMPYEQLPDFMAELYERTEVSAYALRFTILVGARTTEVRSASWAEMEGDFWSIPGERMKMDRDYVVPLLPHARASLEAVRGLNRQFIFGNPKTGKPLSENTMLKLLQKSMRRKPFTVHNFRKTFRTWASQVARADSLVAELCLAHDTRSEIERTYDTGDYLVQRRELLTEWESFACSRLPRPRPRRRVG